MIVPYQFIPGTLNKKPIECPSCGFAHPANYQSLLRVECWNTLCKHYVGPAIPKHPSGFDDRERALLDAACFNGLVDYGRRHDRDYLKSIVTSMKEAHEARKRFFATYRSDRVHTIPDSIHRGAEPPIGFQARCSLILIGTDGNEAPYDYDPLIIGRAVESSPNKDGWITISINAPIPSDLEKINRDLRALFLGESITVDEEATVQHLDSWRPRHPEIQYLAGRWYAGGLKDEEKERLIELLRTHENNGESAEFAGVIVSDLSERDDVCEVEIVTLRKDSDASTLQTEMVIFVSDNEYPQIGMPVWRGTIVGTVRP